ncbi:hypothetical protein QRX60_29350 [Amycolatopsis mongoliensis]|uniref:Uncharacterized protein n=1 Tax=Amycolatopsis mongoliensis TaxID=715475 RepID=A0A9Y2NG04_9PSEU|nr:hypothetical protein [Amycolatopsis sp. 4-36]WIX98172.1 hypothetical protein QRX60_29350 [Amycolatopsis sp. 4-36]
MDAGTLNRREHAILRAVAAGRAELLISCAPDLLIDGGWCDHTAVTRLVSEGWIRPARPAVAGERVPARLTEGAAEALGIPRRQSA